APMGPQVDCQPATGELTRVTLRPFRTSQTFANLTAHGEGVLHVTDDVLLLARSALGAFDPLPPLRPAEYVRGWVLAEACRFHEFRVIDRRDAGPTTERAHFDVEVVHTGRLRDFFGFNRAKHAVVEAAILATRTAFLPLDEIEAEYRKLALLVEKTGGEQEHAAFDFLRRHLQQVKRASNNNLHG
ncbi:MAG: DUF447 domain-containing protein, partial [Gemmataceae bacterium]